MKLMAQRRRSEWRPFTRYKEDMTPPFIGTFTPTIGDHPNAKNCVYKKSTDIPTMNSAVVCSITGISKGTPGQTVTVATEEGYVKLPIVTKGSFPEQSFSPQVSTLELVTHATDNDTALLEKRIRYYQ